MQLQVFASSGLRLACGHFSHTIALAALAGVSQGQGVFVSKHSTTISKARNLTMSSNATTSTRQNTNSNQPKTAKEVIAANVQSLIEQLEAGHSDALTA